jgi:ABC-type dipeptide/oligopeptide/nickel transport system ATPase subunit
MTWSSDMPAPTTRAIEACAVFGISPDEACRCADPSHFARAGATRLDAALCPGESAMIIGASGAGKSSVLRALRRRLRERGQRCITIDPGSLLRHRARVVSIDLFRASPAEALRTLALAGLADATIPALPPRSLSDGQRWRLALAVAIDRAARANRPVTLLIDEFGSALDPHTGASVARSLHRLASRHSHLRIVAAAARVDLVPHFSPGLVARIDGGALHLTRRTPGRPPALALRIVRGTIADYTRLAHLHYRAGPPATHELVLTATTRAGDLAGVLVVSRPTLNGPWRSLAWPGRYRSGSARADAARLNDEVRTISRVIVDPRFRARGVARRLVRAYLRGPLTPATEAIAAMGVCSPFFRAAGMIEYRLGPSRRDARLADALEVAGLCPADLLDSARAGRSLAPGATGEGFDSPVLRGVGTTARASRRRHARGTRARVFLWRELRLWANAGGATRPLLNGPLAELIRAAGVALCAARYAYVHVQKGRR